MTAALPKAPSRTPLDDHRVGGAEKDPKDGRVRVLVAERDSMTGDLLAETLQREGWCEAGAVRPCDLIDLLTTSPPDIAVISGDLGPNGRNGFDLSQAATRAHPELRVVVILGESTRGSVIQAFRSGARGVVSRDQPISAFLECIDHVRRGYLGVGGKELEFLLEGVRHIPAPDMAAVDAGIALTVRELQVVRYAATGKTNKVIARELHLSEHTVKNYMFRAFEKLGVSSRVELLFYFALRGHTFSPPDSVNTGFPPAAPRVGPARAEVSADLYPMNLKQA